MSARPSLQCLSLVAMVVVGVVVMFPAEACLKPSRQHSVPIVTHRTFFLAPRRPPQTQPRRTDGLEQVRCLIDVCYLSLDHPELCRDEINALRTRDAVEPCNDTCAAQVKGRVCQHPIVVQYLLEHYAGLSCGQQWEAIFWSNGSGTNATTATAAAAATISTTTTTITITTTTTTTTTTTLPATSTTHSQEEQKRDQKDNETLITTKTWTHHHHHHHHRQQQQHHQHQYQQQHRHHAVDTEASSLHRQETKGGGDRGGRKATQMAYTKTPVPHQTELIEGSVFGFHGQQRMHYGSSLASSNSGEGGGGEGGEESGKLSKPRGRNISNSEVDSRRKSVKEETTKPDKAERRSKKQDMTRKKEEREEEEQEEQDRDRQWKRTHPKEQSKNKSPQIHIHVKNIHNGTPGNTGFSSVTVWLSVVAVVGVVVVGVVACCGLLPWPRLHGRKRSFTLH